MYPYPAEVLCKKRISYMLLLLLFTIYLYIIYISVYVIFILPKKLYIIIHIFVIISVCWYTTLRTNYIVSRRTMIII